MLINYAGREINAKIVYYGPGLSGKTTNLECIYASVPPASRGKMVSMKTRQDRTLFFDFLPLELGLVHGFRTRFLLYTVPGQVFYNATRKLVLKGADAVVFVADSGLGKMEENQESLRNLEENLREQGLSLETLPWVIQYNKRDLPEVHTVAELQAALNPRGVPCFEAAAATGRGVYETLHAVSRLLFQRLVSELRPAAGRAPALHTAGAPASGPSPARAASQAVSAAPASFPAVSAMPAVSPAHSVSPVPAGGHAVQPVVQAPPRPQRAPEPVHAAAHPDGTGSAGSRARTAPPPTAEALEASSAPAAPNLFGAPTSHVPQPPTPSQILDSVQATAQALEAGPAPQTAPEYGTYGHIVDLSVELGETGAPAPGEGFIKDPLRRSASAAPAPARGLASAAPVRTQHVSVTLSRAELRAGGTIRLVVDVKLEP